MEDVTVGAWSAAARRRHALAIELAKGARLDPERCAALLSAAARSRRKLGRWATAARVMGPDAPAPVGSALWCWAEQLREVC